MVVELPDDPLALASETYNAADERAANAMNALDNVPFELQDENTFDYSKDSWYNNY